MSGEDEAARRVRFFGVGDMAAGFHAERVAEIVGRFDPANVPTSVTDVIELHHVQTYVEHGLLPRAYTEEQVEEAKERVPQFRSTIAGSSPQSTTRTSQAS